MLQPSRLRALPRLPFNTISPRFSAGPPGRHDPKHVRVVIATKQRRRFHRVDIDFDICRAALAFHANSAARLRQPFRRTQRNPLNRILRASNGRTLADDVRFGSAAVATDVPHKDTQHQRSAKSHRTTPASETAYRLPKREHLWILSVTRCGIGMARENYRA